MGVFYFYRWRQDGKRQRERDKKEWIATHCPQIAIISPALFERVQARLQIGRENSRRNTKHEYRLQYRLRCVCGYSVHAGPSGGGHSPRANVCNAHKQPRKYPWCGLPPFYAQDVDTAVWAWLRETFLDEQRLTITFQAMQERLPAEQEKLQQQREELFSRQGKLAQQLQRLLDLYLDDAVASPVAQTLVRGQKLARVLE